MTLLFIDYGFISFFITIRHFYCFYLQIRGLGPGRMTSVQGMATAGVKVVSITEHSALRELGPRPKKIPRI